VLVTHDRFMLQRIATQYIGLDGTGGAKEFMSYEQCNDFRTRTIAPAASKRNAAGPKRSKSKPKPTTRKLTYNEQREYKAMEKTILEAETEVERLETETADPTLMSDHVRAAETYSALSAAHTRVKELYARWAELEAMQSSG